MLCTYPVLSPYYAFLPAAQARLGQELPAVLHCQLAVLYTTGQQRTPGTYLPTNYCSRVELQLPSSLLHQVADPAACSTLDINAALPKVATVSTLAPEDLIPSTVILCGSASHQRSLSILNHQSHRPMVQSCIRAPSRRASPCSAYVLISVLRRGTWLPLRPRNGHAEVLRGSQAPRECAPLRILGASLRSPVRLCLMIIRSSLTWHACHGRTLVPITRHGPQVKAVQRMRSFEMVAVARRTHQITTSGIHCHYIVV